VGGEEFMRPVLIVTTFIGLIASLGSDPTHSQSVLQKAKKGETADVRSEDVDMEAAKQKARSTLRQFLALARDPKPGMSGFAAKIGIPYDGGTEFVWMNPLEFKDNRIIGTINNEPRFAKNVKYRQRISFHEADIVDWMYQENGKMRGNYTACALLKRDTPVQREAFRQEYGLECD